MRANRVQNGVFLILLSMSLTPLGDALSKHLGETQSPLFIVFLRYFVAGLIAVAIAKGQGAAIEFPKQGRVGVVVRTGLVMGAMTLLIVALSMVPLANAVGGFLIAPIVATLISVLAFGEHLTIPRFVGAAISLLGALLILQPGAGVDLGTGFALAGGGLLGAFLALSRNAPVFVNPVSALAVQCLLGSAMIFPFALPGFSGLSFDLIGPAIGLGVVTAATHFLTVLAYQRAEASRLAPFFYFNLVAAVLVGLIWFGEVPTWITLAGLSLIVSGGLVSLISRQSLRSFLRSDIKHLATIGAKQRMVFTKNGVEEWMTRLKNCVALPIY
jgi:drug/metabolite transporter (DMT)-like permease